MTGLTIRPANDNEIVAVATLVAVTFANEPYVRAMLGHGDEVTGRLQAMLELQLRYQYLAHGEVDLAYEADELVGAGLWMASDAESGPTLAKLRRVPSYLRILGRRLPIAIRIEYESVRRQPKFPHWYLSMLAVSPDHQGKGVGRQLLEYRLSRIPADRPVYLEASTAGSARLYARHGFVDMGAVPIGDEPPMRAMWRPAAKFGVPHDS